VNGPRHLDQIEARLGLRSLIRVNKGREKRWRFTFRREMVGAFASEGTAGVPRSRPSIVSIIQIRLVIREMLRVEELVSYRLNRLVFGRFTCLRVCMHNTAMIMIRCEKDRCGSRGIR